MSIRDRILERPDLAALRAARDLDKLAAALNAEGLMAPRQRFITARVILSIHATEGRAILTRLRTAAQQDIGVEFAVRFLEQEAGLDISDPAVWRDIDTLVAQGVLTEAQGALLKALALQPVMVTRDQVREAMYNDDGSEKE
jgi:hypothetical protein